MKERGAYVKERWRGEGGYGELLRIAIPMILSMGSWSLMYFVDRMFLTWYSRDALAAALESQTQMLAAVLEKLSTPAPVPEQKSTLEIAGELAALKDLFTDSKQSVLEQVKDVLELKQMLLEQNDAPADPMAAALKYLGPAIEKGLEAQAETPAAAPTAPPAVAPIAAVNAVPAPPAEATEADIAKAFDIFAEQYLASIMQLSETKQPPAEVCAWIVRMIDGNDQALYVIGLVICQDDMVKRLSAYNDRVLKVAPWLDSVADHLAHALWPESNQVPDADTATIDATIIENDEAGVINGGESQGDTENEPIAGGGPVPDENANPPRAGHHNDA